MNKRMLKNILIVLLLAISMFTIFKYILFLKKENGNLINALNQAKEQAAFLQTEKQNLLQALNKEKELQEKTSQENLALKDNLRTSEIKLTKLSADYGEAQKTIEQLNAQVSLLKAENAALAEQEEQALPQKNDYLKPKPSSLGELKRALEELKKRMSRVGFEIGHKAQTEKIPEWNLEGNQGFLIKNGQPTYSAKIKIEVTPAPKKE